MRRYLSLVVLLPLAGCGDDDPYAYTPNEVVFGIEQSFSADGVATVSGGYDFLGLARAGGHYRPLAFPDGSGDGTCYFERMADRIGKAPSDPGRAMFTGGALPPGGFVIDANAPDPQSPGGWGSSATLHFRASGFAMPSIPEFDFYAPPVSLGITSVLPESTIASSNDVVVTWTPTGSPASIVVSLDVAGAQVRCFTNGSRGQAFIPKKWVEALFSTVDAATPITGHLRIASHKQITVTAEDNWIVYVVATSLHHDSVFTGTRN